MVFLLERLFTSKTRAGILRTLLFRSDKLFYLRELARTIAVSPVYVKKELNNLKKLGLVNESRTGNQLLFQINKNCAIFPEIRGLFLKTDFLSEMLKEQLGLEKIDFAFIFGSFVTGQEGGESDIDLFVVGSVSEDRLGRTIEKIEKKTGREINYILWGKKMFLKRAKKHHLLKEIAKKPVIMIAGDENEFRKIIK